MVFELQTKRNTEIWENKVHETKRNTEIYENKVHETKFPKMDFKWIFNENNITSKKI